MMLQLSNMQIEMNGKLDNMKDQRADTVKATNDVCIRVGDVEDRVGKLETQQSSNSTQIKITWALMFCIVSGILASYFG